MNIAILAGLLLTLSAMVMLGVYSGRSVKGIDDFSKGANKSGALMVCGGLVGTLVGGSSTIGTTQLALTNGFSAIWFTLGGAIGVWILGLFFTKAMKRTNCTTIQEMVTQEYGHTAGILTSVMSILGMFLSLVSQVLSASALLASLSGLPAFACASIGVALMMLYVLFGGAGSAGLLGSVKTVLLAAATVCCGVLAVYLSGGLGVIHEQLPREQYFSLVSRGYGVDLGAGLSLVVGVLSTQAYAQCVLSSKDTHASAFGSTLAAIVTTLIGAGGVMVGLYARLHMPDVVSSQIFPTFVLTKLPGFLSGVVLATLLISIVGTGAGLSLSIGTVAWRNLLEQHIEKSRGLLATRMVIAAALLAALAFTLGALQAIILEWSFMSMALRGAVLFIPLLGALFFPGRIDKRCAVVSIATGPLAVLLGRMFFKLSFDPLFIGIALNIVILGIGYIIAKRDLQTDNQ